MVSENLKKGKEYFGNLKNICVLSLVVVGIVLMLSGSVNAYSGGGGTCYCGNANTTLGGSATDACVDCSAALNDNTNCANQVNYVGTVPINNRIGNCINNPLNFNNKIFDCQGNTIDGDDSGHDCGIYLLIKANNSIKNCIITGFYFGISLYYSSNNTLTNNTANNNKKGISLYYSPNNTLTNNTANNNKEGIYLYYSSNSIMKNNTMKNNTYNFGINGEGISYFYQDIDKSNLVDNKPIYYWTNEKNAPNSCKNAVISELNNTGFVALVSCYNITVKNLNLTKNYDGILLVNTTNSKILNNTANSNSYGIYLYSSPNNTLTNNTASNNSYGINFGYGSNNNTMIANNMCYNSGYDVYNVGNSNSTTGDNNTCVASYNYNDTNSNGCKHVCSIDSCNCSSCRECSYKLSHPSCSQVNLTANISTSQENCINDPLNFNNKIFDCQGHVIAAGICEGQGYGEDCYKGNGIYLSNKQNNTIRNCIITNFSYGISLYSSSNNTLANNTANSNKWGGIFLYSSSNNTLTNNIVKENNMFDIDIGTDSDAHCNNLIENNTGSGDKPIKYFNYSVNLQNEILSELILCNAHNSNINNVTIAGSSTLKNNGLIIYRTENSNFTDINSSDNFLGISLAFSSNNILTNDTVNNNYIGIYLEFSSNNNILTNNTVNNNTQRGIYLDYSSNNTITNNTASNNWNGIYLYSNSNFNRILNNEILNNNETGITISNCNPWGDCDIYWGNSNNTIEGNEISNNKIGIFSQQSSLTINNNTVCGNTNLDFYSSNWLSSYGYNNACSNPDGWNDTGTENGCKNECAKCKEPKDIFDAVEMLEYLSGDKESNPQYCDLNNDTTVNLLDVLALIDKIVIQN
ncbi:putative cell surface protein [groundwater metagenome]|uniref:Putative cell surface protein n=1 Tax=groundwater metagenome TaxID=717931 RepID=A0A098EAF9_9ZZZZ